MSILTAQAAHDEAILIAVEQEALKAAFELLYSTGLEHPGYEYHLYYLVGIDNVVSENDSICHLPTFERPDNLRRPTDDDVILERKLNAELIKVFEPVTNIKESTRITAHFKDGVPRVWCGD